MDFNEKTQYWLELADDDMETARILYHGNKFHYAGFMCHLSIEKGLKAIITNLDDEAIPPKIHDLVKLSKQSGVYNKMDDKQKDFLEFLLPLNIEARYPSQKDNISTSFNNDECNKIIAETEALLDWIKQQL